MGYLKLFFMNTAMLITLAYLANLIYKYTISNASEQVKKISVILLAIFAGWISIVFGYRLDEHVIFDLRFVPLIIYTLAYPRPFILILIGTGIGLSRLSFGINEAAIGGVLNLTILGFVCAALSLWVRRSSTAIVTKGVIVILVVNLMNAININALGVIPSKEYITEIMPITLPAGIVLSALFAFIIRDFQQGILRNQQIRQANKLLSIQTEALRENKIVLEERANQLLITSQYKSKFLAYMSHELRTPLNSIINLSQLIEENDASLSEAEIIEYGGIIHRSGKELLTIINDILDISKVEAGRLDIINEDVNVSEIPELLAMQFDVVAMQNGLDFKVSMEPDVPLLIHSDPHRVQQILLNLLSNAFKFTKQGYVSINIRTEEQLQGSALQRWIVFDVEDTGIGIPRDKQEMIFEAFQQADSTISRKYGGTGLGLSISNDLARLLGGYITVKSEEGKGSLFSLYLPI